MENSVNPTVCFFDSGIGGLCLLYECVRRLPRVDFSYFADNYNVPYGSLTMEKLIEITDEKFDKISRLNPAAAVVACNTVTAQCVGHLRNKYSFEIIGIQPAVKPAVAAGGKCLVLATPATAHSEDVKLLINKYGGGRTVIVPCTGLAPYIEQNINNINCNEVEKLLPHINADSVVLGCTHYVFVKSIIQNFYNCPVFDGIEGTAVQLCKKLGINDHLTKRAQKIVFSGGDSVKNSNIFRLILMDSGLISLKTKE